MEYEQGDRLGHALAVGLNPAQWMQKKKSVLLTREEFFDNCVWLREMAFQMSQKNTKFNPWITFYDNEIHKLQRDLKKGDSTQDVQKISCSSQALFDAYLERKNMWAVPSCAGWNPGDASPDRTRRKPNLEHERLISSWAKDYYMRHAFNAGSFAGKNGDSGAARWFQYILVETGDISCSEDWNPLFEHRETVREEEMNFWEAVQDYLLEMCACRGIILEANPSSNVAISELDCYDSHPVFRWIPLQSEELSPGGRYNRSGLRTGNVRVCVNSDDPGIFCTTLQNEFHLLESAALKHHPPEKVHQWLEQLRCCGVDIFLGNYISPFYIQVSS